MKLGHLLLLPAPLILSTASVSAQELLYNVEFGGEGSVHVAAAGDVNADGYADLLVSYNQPTVYSGFDGSILYAFVDGSATVRPLDGAGDVNADGFDDIVIGHSQDSTHGIGAGRARVYSGMDGSVLYTWYGDPVAGYFGECVSRAGDVDGDGYDDVIVGAPEWNGPGNGYARVFSGIDGSVLYTWYGDSPLDSFGICVAGGGDIDGDGYADLIVGAMGDDDNGPSTGSVRVFSGVDGSTLFTIHGYAGSIWFGRSLANANDVNADGFSDFIVGWGGGAQVFTGPDGSLLYAEYEADWGGDFGHCVGGAGDVNGDGYADFIVSANEDRINGLGSGTARVFSGEDGSLLHAWHGKNVFSDSFSYRVSGAGDVDADGYEDVIVGSYGHHTSSYCQVLASGPVRLELADPVPGQAGTPNTLTVTVATSGATIDFFGARFPGTTWQTCLGGTAPAYMENAKLVGSILADASGTAQITRNVPLRFHGRTLRLQSVERPSCRFTNLVVWGF